MEIQTQQQPSQADAEAEKAAALAAIKARIAAEIQIHEANGLDYGGLLDFDFDIYEVIYGQDANYKAGQVVIGIVKGYNRETGAEVVQFWTVGKDMDTEDEGRRLVPTKPGQKHWHAQSAMGQIYAKIEGGEFGFDCALDLLPQNLMTSGPWEGTSWRMRAAASEFTDKETKELKKFVRSMPAEWLGRHNFPMNQTQGAFQPGFVPPAAGFAPTPQQGNVSSYGQGPGAAAPPTYTPGQVPGTAPGYAPPGVAPGMMPGQAPAGAMAPGAPSVAPAGAYGNPPAGGFAPPPQVQTPPSLLSMIDPRVLVQMVGFARQVDHNTFLAQAPAWDPGIYQNGLLANALASGELQRQLVAYQG